MKQQPSTLPQQQDIQKLTGLPILKIRMALDSRVCSFDRFRLFCLNQGELPTPNQQFVLLEQETNGRPYDYPTEKMVESMGADTKSLNSFMKILENGTK